MDTVNITNTEMRAHVEALLANPRYTLPTPGELDKYADMALQPTEFKMEYAKSHPFLFAYHIIGIKPRAYQFKMLEAMMQHQRVVTVTSRQIGKTTTAAIYAFWAAYTNAFASGPHRDTKVMIISHTEQAAKLLIREIDKMMTLADRRMAIYTSGQSAHFKDYFNRQVKEKNQFEIRFAKGSIMAYPPTAKVRGNPVDILIIDEAAWLNCPDPDYFFASDASPTTTATRGKTFLFSTPKGMSGFFHDIVRPNSDAPLQGWERIIMPWVVVDDYKFLDDIWTKRDMYMAKGDEAQFRIEYECDFTTGRHTYFDPKLIDAAVDDALEFVQSHPTPVVMGVDFGDTHSRTVITAVAYDKATKTITLLWYKEFPQGYNNADLDKYLLDLKKRHAFIPSILVVDDCVGGKTAIELLRRQGFNVSLFQFTRSKHEYLEYMKVAFANRRIKMPRDPTVISQFKQMEAVETIAGNIQVRKPTGGKDDIVMSLLMACSPYILPERRGEWRFANFGEDRKKINLIKV
jgi:hypothetical protein